MPKKNKLGEVKDPRSTGRKRARKVLEQTERPYACECIRVEHDWHGLPCGWKPETQSRSQTLDANHKNKNILDNDPVNLEWLCRRCHKAIDSMTEKGEMHDEEKDKLYGGLLDGYF